VYIREYIDAKEGGPSGTRTHDPSN